MAFNNKLDYIPNQPFSGSSQYMSDLERKKFQTRKWQVLIGTFCLLMVISNIVIWSQAAVYQSQAILHFSYPSQTEQVFADLPQRQITIHTRRLKSSSVLTAVSEALSERQYLNISLQTLVVNLEVEPSLTGRIITLKANGSDPKILKPILETWVEVYLALIDSEKEVSNTEVQESANEQLLLLEQKIVEQKYQVQNFAQSNNITSLERDENRVLNKVKNLSTSLDLAVAEKAEKSALLSSVEVSISNGETLVRPEDKFAIDETRSKLQEITAGLDALSEQYTQAYLERDTVIVARQQEAIKLQAFLDEQIKLSQKAYMQEVQRDVQTASNKVVELQKQLDEQNKLAQTFNQNLEEFKQLDTELKALQAQAQTIKTQQITQQVSKPFDAKISLLEPPFIPDFAISPNYLLNSFISLIGSLIIAILALFLYSFIFKQHVSQGASSNFVVVPGQNVNQDLANLNNQQPVQLNQANPQSLSQLEAPAVRLLTIVESKSLFAVANKQAKVLIGLTMCGVEQQELKVISARDFQKDYSQMTIKGVALRVLAVPSYLSEILNNLCVTSGNEDIWSNLDPDQDFSLLLVNAAHDANLLLPEQIDLNVLRHTYISFLVNQGIKLNDIERVAGFIAPSELARYRHINNQKEAVNIENINTQYPVV
ncbi:MAG: hypothetical protein ABJH28_16800 [Paraglaciecola sp.]|uniref:GumC family protein n=1 Tax=Paraglaciecola sp. TaxID=1920173 RepID=UPI003262E40C